MFRLAELGGDPDTEIRHGELLHNLRFGLTRLRRARLRDLKDGEARQASANAADTMRARSSGIIFDFKSTDPRVQMVGDELLSVAGRHERAGKGMARSDPADLMRCLRYLERQIAAAEKLGRGETFYLDLVAQSVAGEFLKRDVGGLVGGPAQP